MGLNAADAHAVGQLAQFFRRLLGDALAGEAGAEGFRLGEEAAEDVEVFGLREAGEVEGVDLFGGAGEVGVDFEAVKIADDQERRVVERFAVLEELVVGRLEVGPLLFVFPAEMVLHPDVGPAFAAVGFGGAALEAVPGAFGIGAGWLRLAEKLAQVEEVLLAGGAFREFDRLPLGDELLGSHAGR